MALTPRPEFHALTDTGRVRAQNEDAVAVHARCGLMLLADGMGGYNAGEVASTLAIDHIGAHMSQWLNSPEGHTATPGAVARALEDSAQQANHAILGAALAHAAYAGMGTTLVAGVFHGDWLVLGHIGDSRGYRLRAGALEQLTHDHSWLQEQVDAGLITAQQAAHSVQRNLVTRALGVESAAQLEVHQHRVQPGDLYLLCSDGLTDQMQPHDLQELAHQDLPLPEKARRLVALANALGGRDNISVVLAQVAAAPTAAAPAQAGPGAPPGLMARLLQGHGNNRRTDA